MKKRVSGLAIMMGFLVSGVAAAQEPTETEAPVADDAAAEGEAPGESEEAAVTEEAPAEEAPAAEAAPAADAKPTSATGGDGARFRFGISGGAGFVSNSAVPTGFYAGGDLRLGVQVNDLIGVYAMPQLGFYGVDGYPVGGGILGATGVVEVTLFDRGFVGVGGGYGIMNSPSGPELHFRIGGYPLVSRSDEKVRRKGLSLAADIRMYFVDGYPTFISPTFNIGYEAF